MKAPDHSNLADLSKRFVNNLMYLYRQVGNLSTGTRRTFDKNVSSREKTQGHLSIVYQERQRLIEWQHLTNLSLSAWDHTICFQEVH